VIEVTRGRENTGSHDFILLTHQWRDPCMCLCVVSKWVSARGRMSVCVFVLYRTHPEPPGLRITFGSWRQRYDRGQRDAGLGSNILLSAEQMSVCKCARIHRDLPLSSACTGSDAEDVRSPCGTASGGPETPW